MDNDNQAEVRPRSDSDLAGQQDTGTVDDASGATMIGANITGVNASSYPGAVVGPAAEVSAAEAGATEDSVGPLNLDALDQFANKESTTGDDRVTTRQSEIEADELNG